MQMINLIALLLTVAGTHAIDIYNTFALTDEEAKKYRLWYRGLILTLSPELMRSMRDTSLDVVSKNRQKAMTALSWYGRYDL